MGPPAPVPAGTLSPGEDDGIFMPIFNANPSPAYQTHGFEIAELDFYQIPMGRITTQDSPE